MSLKQRVCDIAREVAVEVSRNMAEIRMRQLQQSLNTMATVDKVNGNQIDLKMPDGTIKTVTNMGGRIVGAGDKMVTDGRLISF